MCYKKYSMILYTDDAVLIYAASTPATRMSLNVNKTKMMLAGSRTKSLKFQNFEFKLDEEMVSRVPEFKYLGIMQRSYF